MPLMSGREAAVADGNNTGNVLSGEDFEFIDRPSLVSVAAVADGTPVVATMVIGTERQLNEAPLSLESAADRVIFDEDIILDQEFAPAGARLNLNFRNDSGAAADVNWRVRVEAIPASML